MLFEILGITLLNVGMVGYTIKTYHIHYYSVAVVLTFAVVLTALLMYEKIHKRLMKYGNATELSISLVVAISAMIFLQFSLYHYSLGLGFVTAVIAGLETYLLRDALNIQ